MKLIRQSENRGFGSGNNVAAKVATGEFLFLLNTDTQLTGDILPVLVGPCKNILMLELSVQNC